MTERRAGASPWFVLTIVCLAQFMVVLDATIVNVALPTLERELGFSETSLPWVINAYTLIFGGFLLLGGRAADLFGRKRIFIAGVAIFTIASMLVGISDSPDMMIVTRGLQGLGAALVSPAALSILTTSFAEGAERTKAMGVWAAIAVGGGAVGLLLGGVLVELTSWRWIFFVNVPVGVVTLLLAIRSVPESRDRTATGFDLVGALSVTGGMVVLVYAIVQAAESGWLSARTLLLFLGAVVLLAAFILWERRVANPLVRLGLFRTRSLAGANLTMLVVAGGMFAIFFFATLYVQQILGLSPIEAGLGFLPLTAGIIVAAGLSQGLIPRLGVRAVSIAGMVIAAVGLLLLSVGGVDGTYLAHVLPGLTVMGVGLGFVFMPMTLVATTNIDPADAGLASGIFNTSQQIGGALGLAILSTLAAERTSRAGGTPQEALVEGYRVGYWVAAALMLVGVVMTLALIRRRDVTAIEASPHPAPVV